MDKINIADTAKLDFVDQEADMEQKLDNYKDVGGVSMRGLSFGLWYLQHRRAFFLCAVWLLSVVATVLWCYSLYYFGYYLLVGLKNDRINNNAMTDNPLALEQRQVSNRVSYGFTQAVDLGNGSYSLVGTFKNDNPINWALYDYYFLVDGQQSVQGPGFILPQDNKFIAGVIDGLPSAPKDVKLVIDNLRWNTINTHTIDDWSQYKNDYLDFLVLDKKFVGADQSSLSDRLPVNTVSFNITNRTAYNYIQAPLQVILYSGSGAVYVKRYIVNNFASKDRRDINLSIIGNLPNVDRIEVIPEINIMDSGVFF